MAAGHWSRRALIFGGGLALLGGAGAWYALSRPQPLVDTLSVSDAYRAAQAQDIFLVDIRRADEWARTGIGEGAVPIDMRRPDFTAALDRLTKGDRSAPIALICARGVRSRYLSAALSEAGFTHIIDVPEGMLGSFAGPGWLKTGLPVVAYAG